MGSQANAAAAERETAIIIAAGVNFTVDLATGPFAVLKNVSLRVNPAEVVAIIGPSGSGKTSLLMLLAGLDRPTSGDIVVAGQRLNDLGEDELALFRRRTLGIVFQSFHLIPSLSALDNVAFALEIASPELHLDATRSAAAQILAAVGLGHRLSHRPAALSGGEQQRAALARAMITEPRLLLADEPTGNLDQASGAIAINLMLNLARRRQTAVVLVTHDPGLAARADRILSLNHGELSDVTSPDANGSWPR